MKSWLWIILGSQKVLNSANDDILGTELTDNEHMDQIIDIFYCNTVPLLTKTVIFLMAVEQVQKWQSI